MSTMPKKEKKQPETLRIRNKYEFWNDFIVSGKENNLDNELIKAQILDAIRKEVFDQMCWRMKVSDLANAEHTPENERIVESITKETRKKWAALIRMCNERLATLNLLHESDLNDLFSDPEEDEDEGYEFQEADEPKDEEEIPVVPGQRFPAGYWTR